MKKRLVLTIALSSVICVQSYAAYTVEQISEPEFLINNGYSEATAEEVFIMKNRTVAKPVEPLYNKSNRFVRFCRNIFGYIEPAQDTDERLHHDVHQSPSWKDL